MTRTKAYTLAVAVLVALILLAGFLLPLFKRARETHHPPACICQMNLLQIALAMQQFAQHHQSRYPDSFGVLLKEGYLTTTRVFRCSTGRGHAPDGFPQDPTAASAEELKTVDAWSAFAIVAGVSANDPGDFIIAHEKPPGHRLDDAEYWESWNKPKGMGHLPGDTRVLPCAFCDGHLEWLTEDDLQRRLAEQEAKLRDLTSRKEGEQ